MIDFILPLHLKGPSTSCTHPEHNDEDADVDNCLQALPGKSDASIHSATGLSNEEDISFCDLEDEDDTLVQTDSANNGFMSKPQIFTKI